MSAQLIVKTFIPIIRLDTKEELKIGQIIRVNAHPKFANFEFRHGDVIKKLGFYPYKYNIIYISEKTYKLWRCNKLPIMKIIIRRESSFISNVVTVSISKGSNGGSSSFYNLNDNSSETWTRTATEKLIFKTNVWNFIGNNIGAHNKEAQFDIPFTKTNTIQYILRVSESNSGYHSRELGFENMGGWECPYAGENER